MSSAGPRVSIALCVWNGATHLPALLDSLLAQRLGDFEIVALDDASTDDSVGVLERYAARDPRLRVSSNPRNLGYNENFARALALCHGTFVAPCDQDDVWRPNKLAALVAAIGEADLAYCDSEFMDAAGHATGARMSGNRRMVQGTNALQLVTTNSVSGHAMVFRREILARAQPFPDAVHYDWWLAIVAASGRGIRYVDEPLVLFRRHEGTATGIGRTSAQPRLREWLEGREKHLRAMARLQGPRQREIVELHARLEEALRRGRWLPLVRAAWRYRRELGYIIGPRLPALARGMLSAG